MLCRDHDCDLLRGMSESDTGPGAAVDELAALDLGDVRLNGRARHVVAALARNPAAGFPAAVATDAEREALYRLLGNQRVTLSGSGLLSI